MHSSSTDKKYFYDPRTRQTTTFGPTICSKFFRPIREYIYGSIILEAAIKVSLSHQRHCMGTFTEIKQKRVAAMSDCQQFVNCSNVCWSVKKWQSEQVCFHTWWYVNDKCTLLNTDKYFIKLTHYSTIQRLLVTSTNYITNQLQVSKKCSIKNNLQEKTFNNIL